MSIIVYSNCYLVLALTYFTARSNLVFDTFKWEKTVGKSLNARHKQQMTRVSGDRFGAIGQLVLGTLLKIVVITLKFGAK